MADGITPVRTAQAQSMATPAPKKKPEAVRTEYTPGIDPIYEEPGDRSTTNPSIQKAIFRYIEMGDSNQTYLI